MLINYYYATSMISGCILCCWFVTTDRDIMEFKHKLTECVWLVPGTWEE